MTVPSASKNDVSWLKTSQQKTDREILEAIQRAGQEASRQAHREDLATKESLARVMDDFIARREVLFKKKEKNMQRNWRLLRGRFQKRWKRGDGQL